MKFKKANSQFLSSTSKGRILGKHLEYTRCFAVFAAEMGLTHMFTSFTLQSGLLEFALKALISIVISGAGCLTFARTKQFQYYKALLKERMAARKSA